MKPAPSGVGEENENDRRYTGEGAYQGMCL